ncbi:MAG: sulfatase [Provencibacterium sp.]|jgi:arylsulfatase A-like enzyme|nr:sulfatase [Provencibacterium sp.]
MPKPNILYVFADQLRDSSLGCRGDRRAKTPHIDRFAACSADMTNAVSGHPVCAPYRASLFTGKYTTSTGMVINEIRMNPRHRCLAHVLGDAGYETAYIGKWHMYASEWGNHYDPKNSFIPKGEDRLGFDGFFAAYNFHHEYYGAPAYYHLDTPDKIYCSQYEPDEQTDMALERLAELSQLEKPFALFLSLGTPHDPWIPENVPGKYLELFKDIPFELPENYLPENDPHADAWARLSERERRELTEWMRVYYAMVANLDDNFGRLMREVERLGLDKNTIVVFTSDHGELFGAHGRRAKNIFYEEAVRVPFFLRWPGKVASGVCDTPFNTVDIMPTLLSMLELPVPKEAEGRDASEYLLRRCPEAKLPGSLMMGTGATATFEDGHEWRAWRDERYTYAEYLCDGERLLFDNREDPLQMRNLAGLETFRQVEEELRQKMYAEMERIGDTFAPCSYYEKNWIEDRIIRRTATLREG